MIQEEKKMSKYLITVNGGSYEVTVEEIGGVAPVAVAPKAAPAPAAAPAPKAAPVAAGAETVAAPMPGNILSVNVAAGQSVKSGDVMLILEAMKMENEILATRDGVVAQVAVTKGATVNTGDTLVVLN